MDIKHVLSAQPAAAGLRRKRRPPRSGPDPLGWVDVEGGLVEIGHAGDGFRFDNEEPRHRVWLEPYRLADRLVTNGEWLEFMADGGYAPARALALRRLGEGQRRRLARAAVLDRARRRLVRAHPARHLAGGPGAPGEPRQLLRGRGVRHLGGQAAAERGRVGARRRRRRRGHRWRATSPTPTRSTRARPARRTGRLRQVYGDCWEWTSSAYHPYPGFHPADGRDRRVQRQVHVEPDGAARRLRPHARRATHAPPTATSSRTRHGGRCPASGSPTAARPRGSPDARGQEPVVSVLLDPDWASGSPRRGRTPRARCRSRAACRRSGSTTTAARRSSTRSPACRSTTRPSASARSCASTRTRSLGCPAPPRWSSSGAARPTRPARCSTRSPRTGQLQRFVPVDVSEATLRQAAEQISAAYPGVQVEAVVGDFTLHLRPSAARGHAAWSRSSAARSATSTSRSAPRSSARWPTPSSPATRCCSAPTW